MPEDLHTVVKPNQTKPIALIYFYLKTTVNLQKGFLQIRVLVQINKC